LIGIAIDHGLLQGVNEKVVKFFPEYIDPMDPKYFFKEKITIENMLLMSTGILWNEFITLDGKTINSKFFLNEPIRYYLEKPLVSIPGNQFIYNDGTTDMLGEIIRKVSQKSLVDFAEYSLFSPIGISSYIWLKYPKAPKITFATAGLYLRPRDMAKIGQLCIMKGMWKNKRILSTKWIESSTSTSAHISKSSYNPMGSFAWGYGYHWWLAKYDYGNIKAYAAAGWGNQFIIIIPQVNIVVVMTGGDWQNKTNFEDCRTIVNKYILPSLKAKS
jgi:CubicO group peptidase (beta-lactamase class C family)